MAEWKFSNYNKYDESLVHFKCSSCGKDYCIGEIKELPNRCPNCKEEMASLVDTDDKNEW